jgi:hypothetical protein
MIKTWKRTPILSTTWIMGLLYVGVGLNIFIILKKHYKIRRFKLYDIIDHIQEKFKWTYICDL